MDDWGNQVSQQHICVKDLVDGTRSTCFVRLPKISDPEIALYRSGTVNSNTVNSKFHLIRSYCEYLARILSFHV